VEVVTKLAQAWKNARPETKEKYAQLALKEKEEYLARVTSDVGEVVKARSSKATKGSKEEKKAPAKKASAASTLKKPRSAYILFSSDERKKIATQTAGTNPNDVMKILGKNWSAASPQVKHKYETLATREKEEYARAKAGAE